MVAREVANLLRAYLAPGAAEQDEVYRKEVAALSHTGLRIIGGIEIVVPLFMLAGWFLITPDPANLRRTFGQLLFIVVLGLATTVVARTAAGRQRARLLAAISGWLVAALGTWASLSIPGTGQYVPAKICVVLLTGVAAVPFRPLQVLAMGLSIEAFYAVSIAAAARWSLAPARYDSLEFLFLTMVTLLCTGLNAVLYTQRALHHREHMQALRVTEDLCRAQSRILLSENAATMGRLAATLSHELNSPIGALTSAVETLVSLAVRQRTAPPGQQQKLLDIQRGLEFSVQGAATRLRKIVARIQRFTNMDNAEVQSANLDQLLSDVAALLEPQMKGRVKLELDFRPLPPVPCRPQQLSAVFSHLLGNAIHAIHGDGHIIISTYDRDSQAEVRIQDNGRGMPAAELATIFEPGFRVSGNRVQAGHWSLFSSRQIIHEHGGRIAITSAEGQGTTVTVTLPYIQASGLMATNGVERQPVAV